MFDEKDIQLCEKRLSSLESKKYDSYLKLTGVEDQHLPGIVEMLNKFPHITHLNLTKNSIRDRYGWLCQLKYITVLDLSSNNINGKTVLSLLVYAQFQEINLENNRMMENAGEIIANNTTQLKLNVTRCGISAEWMEKIAARIEQNNASKELAEQQPNIQINSSNTQGKSCGFFQHVEKKTQPGDEVALSDKTPKSPPPDVR